MGNIYWSIPSQYGANESRQRTDSLEVTYIQATEERKGECVMVKTLLEVFSGTKPMKGLSQREILMKWVKYNYPNPVPSWKVQSTETPFGWLGTSGDRIARTCVAEGLLTRSYHLIKGVRFTFFALPATDEEQLNLF